MKKKIILLIAVLLLIGGSCFAYNIIKHLKAEYPNHRWDDGFTRYYSEDMKQKYPDIVQISKKETRNRDARARELSHTPDWWKFRDENHYFDLKQNENGDYGVFEKETGKQIIPYKYKKIEPCSAIGELYFMFFNVQESDKNLILDYKNNVLIENKYDELECRQFYCGIKTRKGDKIGAYSYSGIEVLKPEYNSIECQEHFGESGGWYYIAQKGDKYGVWDNHGKKIIPLQKKKLKPLKMHFFRWEYNGKKGIMDIYGNLLSRAEYEDIMYRLEKPKPKATNSVKRSNPLDIKARKDIITRNDLVSKYKEVEQLSEDYYAVRDPEHGMFIVDKYGEKTSDKTFPTIYKLNDKYAAFLTYDENGEPEEGVIDFQGNIIVQDKNITYIPYATDDGLILFTKEGKFGLYYKNQLLVPPEYNKIYLWAGHVIILIHEDDGNYYLVSSYKDFIENNGDFSKCAKYRVRQYKKVSDKCFKFVNEEDNSEVMYCDK